MLLPCSCSLLILIGSMTIDDPATNLKQEELVVSKPVACKTVEGYRKYVALEKVALTKDEKLLVYLEVENPTEHIAAEPSSDMINLNLTQDIHVRKPGTRKPLWSKTKLHGLEVRGKSELGPVYLSVIVGIKSLEPGRYELDIVVHDQLAESRMATVTLPFEVLPDLKADPSPDPISLMSRARGLQGNLARRLQYRLRVSPLSRAPRPPRRKNAKPNSNSDSTGD